MESCSAQERDTKNNSWRNKTPKPMCTHNKGANEQMLKQSQMTNPQCF